MTEPTQFDPYAPSIEPQYPEMAGLRNRCPVARTPSGWFVSTYETVRSVLHRVEVFSGDYIDTSTFPPDELALPTIDEPEHGRVRKIVNGAIARHKTADMEPFIRHLAGDLLDAALAEVRRSGTVDLVESYASPIPSRVVARALGVPVDDFDQFRRWADELVDRIWDQDPAPYSELHPVFCDYIQQLIERRRRQPVTGDDFISRTLAAGMSDGAVRTNSVHLILAGTETTRSMIGNCLYRLAVDRNLFDEVRADRSKVPVLIEESLRYDSPVQVMGRRARADVLIGGVVVPADQHVIVGVASANRDSAVYEGPDEFRLDRVRPTEHLAFGSGPHVCPGASLARLEGVVAMEEFVRRVGGISLADGHRFDGNPRFWSRAPLSLSVSLVESKESDR
jgi:cytochrome P450